MNINKLALLFSSSLLIVSCQLKVKESKDTIKLIPVRTNNLFQYVDLTGRTIINPQFAEATIFRDGLALVKLEGDEGNFGYINEVGNFVIQPIYKAATSFSEGLAWVVAENEAPSVINKDGVVLFTCDQCEVVGSFHDGLAPFMIVDVEKNMCGFMDKTGQVKINPQFTEVGTFSHNLCPVKNEGNKWGYIDLNGKLTINYQFDMALSFVEGKAVVFFGKKAGVIDLTGRYILNPQYENVIIDGEMNAIQQDGKWGWCDNAGKTIINPQFSSVFPFFGNDLAPVKSGKTWGFIDLTGRLTINSQFDLALPFNGDFAPVLLGEKIGTVDINGKYLINPQYDAISSDYATYIASNGSLFEMVKSDYFDFGNVVDRISLDNPEGLNFTYNISQAISKFDISSENLSIYEREHSIFYDKRISDDATLNFGIYSYAVITNTDGWYNEDIFNPSAALEGFHYTINLNNRGEGKAQYILEAIEAKMSGFILDEDLSDDKYRYYRQENGPIAEDREGPIEIFISIDNGGNQLELYITWDTYNTEIEY